jgi:hypothetical protein
VGAGHLSQCAREPHDCETQTLIVDTGDVKLVGAGTINLAERTIDRLLSIGALRLMVRATNFSP